LLADAAEGVLGTCGPVDDLVAALVARGAEPVLLDDWRAIDAAETALGATRGRARTTLHERESLLAAVRAAATRPR
ncbi:MAG TPA: NADP oxidoreductase, partial [Blastococcus sp.]